MKNFDSKFLVVFVTFALLGSCDSQVPENEKVDLIDYVDPFIGTDFHGHTYPGPVMPHGMMQVGPDTKLN